MLDLALLILFCVMAYRVIRGVRREAPVLKEFGQSQWLALVALLFPLGPLVLLFGSVWLGAVIAFPLAFACYVPALFVARNQSRALESSGTDRVQRAQSTMSQAFVTAFIGLAYVVVVAVFVFGASNLSSITP